MNPFSQMKLWKFLHDLLLHVIFGEEKAFWSGEKDSKLDPHEYLIVVNYLVISRKDLPFPWIVPLIHSIIW